MWVCVDAGAQSVPGDAALFSPGDQSDHKLALRNIASMVRPGGVLVIDHRNYDHILATGCAPPGKNIYYKVGGCCPRPIPLPSATTPFPELGPGSGGTPTVLLSPERPDQGHHHLSAAGEQQGPHGDPGLHGAGPPDGGGGLPGTQVRGAAGEAEPRPGLGACPASWPLPPCSKFRLSYYPHRLEAFTALLKGAFQGKCQHSVLGDFQPYTPGQAHVPCYFIHVVKKTA